MYIGVTKIYYFLSFEFFNNSCFLIFLYRRSSSSLSVRYGSSIHKSGGTVVGVQIIKQHPDYKWLLIKRNDISVLKLEGDINFSTKAMPIDIGTPPGVGTSLMVSGWGALWLLGPSPDQLQAVEIKSISLNDCRTRFNVDESHICASMIGKDSCYGDSGSPLIDIATKKLVGIVSYGHDCAISAYPGVYTNVDYYRQWISEMSS